MTHPVFRDRGRRTGADPETVALNLAEGAGHIGGSRKHHWRIAYGSALESSSAMGLLQAAGTINHQRASEAEALFDRCRAMMWRLIHGYGEGAVSSVSDTVPGGRDRRPWPFQD